MTINERVNAVRKSKEVNLTMEKFGERIGIKKGAISLIESGKNNLTDANVKAICREFGVDYMWLTTGDGEMFLETDDDFMERVDRIMAGENDVRKDMLKTLLNASDADIESLNDMIEYYVDLRGGSK